MPTRKGSRDNFQIRVQLKGEMARRFNTIKDAWGLENNAEVVRMLITQKYEEIINKPIAQNYRDRK